MSAPEPAPDPKPSRAGRLLALVRSLIEHGTRFAAALRQHGLAAKSTVAFPFGTTDIALILARIARGLLLAEALEARIIRDTPRLDAGPAAPRAPSHRRSPPARTATARPADNTQLDLTLVPGLDPGISLPTAEQIAAEVRRRPIGAVIADICRDLGIMPNHPLWPELRDLITRHGGNLAMLLKDIFDRTLGPVPSARSLRPAPAPALQSPAPSSTGPP
jgi:hypothetical protein